MHTIGKDSTVTMHFDLRLKDGSIAESSRSIGRPMTFQMGQGIFSAAMEEKLLGCKAGDKPKIMLLPQDAFGEVHPANIYQMPKAQFERQGFTTPLEVGLIISFRQINGQEFPGIVRKIEEDEVTIDFNHPLAGHVVLFDIEILEIR